LVTCLSTPKRLATSCSWGFSKEVNIQWYIRSPVANLSSYSFPYYQEATGINNSWQDPHSLMYLHTCSVLMSSQLLYQLLEESQMWTFKRYLSRALFSQLYI
jgi:hypothetical protein